MAIFTKCEVDPLNNSRKSETFIEPDLIKVDVEIKDGRMAFSDISSIQKLHSELKDLSDTELKNRIEDYYEFGFQELRPILTLENEDELYKIHQKRLKSIRSKTNSSKTSNCQMSEEFYYERLDDIEDFIGDDAFSSFLNTDAEVQIGESIYKYTDVGLFIVDTDNYEVLPRYLKDNLISEDLITPTSPQVLHNYINQEAPNTGYVQVSNELQYFRSSEVDSESILRTRVKSPCDTYSTYSGNTDNTTPTSSFDNFIENTQNCNSRNSFIPMFGKAKICIDRYEDKKRVKTKAFDYNYGVVFHLGVKVKHQKKGWTGIWRQTDADEIAVYVKEAI